MDRAVFYKAIRPTLFATAKRPAGVLTPSQVKGIDELLNAWPTYGTGIRSDLAHILAEVHHETGRKMIPVREGFATTDAKARQIIARRKYAKVVNGHVYYGRGRVQNTWYDNYAKLGKRFNLPIAEQPDLLLDPALDAKVTILGHVEGIWTGKKLSDYTNANGILNHKQARRIVNGQDKADLIASYAVKYDDALKAAGMPMFTTSAEAAVSAKPQKEKTTMPAPAKKPWWQSMGILGGAGAILAPIVGTILGVQVTAEDTELTIELATAAVTAISGIFAVVGRIRATKRIK